MSSKFTQLADDGMFRTAMRLLAGGVTVVATNSEGERSALTATAVCSLALSPARILACINIRGRTYELLTRSRCMSINLLSQDHHELARRFAGMLGSPEDHRFVDDAWQEGATGAPLLVDALAALDCRITQITALDTHAIVIGVVQELRFGPRRPPLLHFGGNFTTALSAVSG